MEKKKGLVLGGLLLLGIGFAAVSTTLYLNGDVNISANSEDFDVRFTRVLIDSEDKTSEAISTDGKTITYTTKELGVVGDKSRLDFEVTNNSSIYDAEVSIECTSGEAGEYYQITKEVASSIPSKKAEKGSVEVEKINMATEDIEEAFTCTLTANAVERTTKGDEKEKVLPNHIVDTGERCFENKEAGSCAPGTEIRYMVNDTTEKTFYVLHDDGETMTIQQRENTISSIVWDSSDNNTEGPLTVLPALENSTNGWSNVNTINYTMGTTDFGGKGAYTGCSAYNSCTTNAYTMSQRSGKARMITVQEAAAVGCTGSSKSCPVWMYDYLSSSKDFGGTTNGTDYGYWIMNASSSVSSRAWDEDYFGHVYNLNTNDPNYGARAVVEISK